MIGSGLRSPKVFIGHTFLAAAPGHRCLSTVLALAASVTFGGGAIEEEGQRRQEDGAPTSAAKRETELTGLGSRNRNLVRH